MKRTMWMVALALVMGFATSCNGQQAKAGEENALPGETVPQSETDSEEEAEPQIEEIHCFDIGEVYNPLKDSLGTKRMERFTQYGVLDSTIARGFRLSVWLPKQQNRALSEVLNDELFYAFSDLGGFAETARFLGKNYRDEKMVGYYDKLYRTMYKSVTWMSEEGTLIGPLWKADVVMKPVWESADGKQVTYLFSSDLELGGAHGLYHAYYMTFDMEKNRPLGFKDFFPKNQRKKVLDRLVEKVAKAKEIGKESALEIVGKDSRWYDEESMSVNMVEKYDGWVIPRPARVSSGYVFSYQPYWIGCFAEGDLHLVID